MAGETIALLLALLIGVSLGALGSGGSIVTLPILVYVAGVAPKLAVGMSMAIVEEPAFSEAIFIGGAGTFLRSLPFCSSPRAFPALISARSEPT
jgi:uncharacterized membrane protein YfcA